MKAIVKYTLQVCIDSADGVVKKFIDSSKYAYQMPWVELCEGFDETEPRYACITYPNPDHPELTSGMFFKFIKFALPTSKHSMTALFFEAALETQIDNKPKNAVSIQHGFFDDGSKVSIDSWYKPEIFANDMAQKIQAIRKIVGVDDCI